MGSAAVVITIAAAVVVVAGEPPNWRRPCYSEGERGTFAGVGGDGLQADGDGKTRRKARRRGDGRRYP